MAPSKRHLPKYPHRKKINYLLSVKPSNLSNQNFAFNDAMDLWRCIIFSVILLELVIFIKHRFKLSLVRILRSFLVNHVITRKRSPYEVRILFFRHSLRQL